MKSLIANTIVKWFKQLGFAGALRWRILYWCYKITGWHIRQYEWDFVLNYLPKLAKWQHVRVLDVGATSSLFIYEIARRGYITHGTDCRLYQEKLPDNILFFGASIEYLNSGFDYDFIVCVSVLEHIKNRVSAVSNMMKLLKPGGRLLLTIPTMEYAQGHPWTGFDYCYLQGLIRGTGGQIIDYSERAGQICVAIGKI